MSAERHSEDFPGPDLRTRLGALARISPLQEQTPDPSESWRDGRLECLNIVILHEPARSLVTLVADLRGTTHRDILLCGKRRIPGAGLIDADYEGRNKRRSHLTGTSSDTCKSGESG